ncbi:MAG: hypothetical protein JNM89_09070 [Hyphomicrobiaceae bacterium]|nr:hypothetical protein [Hyphomicrobiaceae bacterium]
MTGDGTRVPVWLAAIAAGALLVAVALRLGLGARWFSFYGFATVTLAVISPTAVLVLRRLKASGRRRWPAALLIAATALAAVTQIVFWLVFFHGGNLGFMLGVGRSMLRGHLEAALPWLGLVLTAAWLALVAFLYRVDR